MGSESGGGCFLGEAGLIRELYPRQWPEVYGSRCVCERNKANTAKLVCCIDAVLADTEQLSICCSFTKSVYALKYRGKPTIKDERHMAIHLPVSPSRD